jgi:hypothetical protein
MKPTAKAKPFGSLSKPESLLDELFVFSLLARVTHWRTSSSVALSSSRRESMIGI